MTGLPLSFAGRCAGILLVWLASCASSQASEAQLLPFFSKPYPSGYTRPTRLPDAECWAYRQVNTLLGSYIERVWICGAPLIERY